MRWPWRRRRGEGRVVFIGTSPYDVAAAINAVPTPSPVVAAWVPDPAPAPATPAAPPAAPLTAAAPAAAPPPGPAPAAEPRPGVQLGFADGSVMTLADDDPRSVALRAAAARLTAATD